MNRRELLAVFAGAPAARALPLPAGAIIDPDGSRRHVKIHTLAPPAGAEGLVGVHVLALVCSAFRFLGVIIAGELPPIEEMNAALTELRMLGVRPDSGGFVRETPAKLWGIRLRLAARLAPSYGAIESYAQTLRILVELG